MSKSKEQLIEELVINQTHQVLSAETIDGIKNLIDKVYEIGTWAGKEKVTMNGETVIPDYSGMTTAHRIKTQNKLQKCVSDCCGAEVEEVETTIFGKPGTCKSCGEPCEAVEEKQERLLGVDTGNEDDEDCRVYGYHKGDTTVITRVEHGEKCKVPDDFQVMKDMHVVGNYSPLTDTKPDPIEPLDLLYEYGSDKSTQQQIKEATGELARKQREIIKRLNLLSQHD